MELYIYNKELKLVGIIDSFISLRWVRRYSKVGEFELHCIFTEVHRALLINDNLIYKKNDDELGVIEGVDYSQGKGETIVVKGRFITSYLGRRIAKGTYLFNESGSVAMKRLVNLNCVNPTENKRKIPLLSIKDNADEGILINNQISNKDMLLALEDISNVSEVGYKIIFDPWTRELEFLAYMGVDRTSNQSKNTIAIFSQEFDNILEQQYSKDKKDLRTMAYVGGEGEGSERTIVKVNDENSGLDRRELFVDAKDLQRTVDDIVLTDTQYNDALSDRGKAKLEEFKLVESFESKTQLNESLVYKKDFDLGDKVTNFSRKWKVRLDTRITEIEEVYENNSLSITPIFGTGKLTLGDKLKAKYGR